MQSIHDPMTEAPKPQLTAEQDAYLRERSDLMGAWLVLHALSLIHI